jgi:ABC-type nitrate/sulfonate/bicarbonate transport system ATPase subunit
MTVKEPLEMIAVKALTFRYPGGKPVFAGFDWRVDQGEAWAILGPSGCGKSTLLYLLAGLRKPEAGCVQIAGHLLARPRPRTGLILQDFGLLPWGTVVENASLGLRVRRFYGPDGRHAPKDDRVAQAGARLQPWLERLGLADLKESYPSQLSGGQRQRTAIARTLALEPDLLLMDEPFAALDAPTRESLQDLVLDLQVERSLTLVLVTHTIEEAAVLGRRVLVLGLPPNRQPLMIDNPLAGNPAYRGTSAYLDMCNSLRQALESVS